MSLIRRPRRATLKRRELRERPRSLQLLLADVQGTSPHEETTTGVKTFKALKRFGEEATNTEEDAYLLHTASLHSYGGTDAGWQGTGGFQAEEKRQVPEKRFPGTLSSYVLVFQTDEEWHTASLYPKKPGKGQEPNPLSYAKLNMQPIVDKLRSADMIVREMYSSKELDWENKFPYMFVVVSIGEKRQQTVAEVMGEHKLMRIRMRKMDDLGNEIKNGGAWTTFKQHLAPYYEKSTEGQLFSSAQQQQMMEFLMNEGDSRVMGPQLMQKESCETGNTILQQMVIDERIVAYFPLHHKHKRQWLKDHWCDSFFTRQPIEDVREYFGEEIALFFVWQGYLCTMLWIPAAVGIWVTFMQMIAYGESSSIDNPYNTLYALMIAVWAIVWSGGFKRLQNVYQHEWDTVNYTAPSPDRRDFLQNPSTYKSLNSKLKIEEFYPDPLHRIGWLVVSTIAAAFLIAVNLGLLICIEVVIKTLSDILGIPVVAVIAGAILQGLLMLALRLLFGQVLRLLNDKENWKTDEQYNRGLMSKLFAVGFTINYSAIIFYAFIANDLHWHWVRDVSCPEHKCLGYINFMATIIFIIGHAGRPSISHAIVTGFKQLIYGTPASEQEPETEFKPDAKCRCTMCVQRPLTDDEKAAEEALGLGSLYVELTKETDKPEKGGQPPWTMDDFYVLSVTELGYIILFGAMCPLLAAILLVLKLMQLRRSAHYFLFALQRPRYTVAKDIGKWETIVDILVLLGVICQCSWLAFVSNGLYYYFPYMTEVDKTFYAVIFEHVLLFFKILFDGATSHVPADVDLAYKVKNHELSISLEHFDTKEDDNVKFYTDDEGYPYYGN